MIKTVEGTTTVIHPHHSIKKCQDIYITPTKNLLICLLYKVATDFVLFGRFYRNRQNYMGKNIAEPMYVAEYCHSCVQNICSHLILTVHLKSGHASRLMCGYCFSEKEQFYQCHRSWWSSTFIRK